MQKYAKVIDNETKEVSVAASGTQWVISQGYTSLYVEQSDVNGGWYLAGFAPMKSDENKAKEERLERINEIKAELAALDVKRIRAMCEPSDYDGSADDDNKSHVHTATETTSGAAKPKTWLEYYNEQAQALRNELQQLGENYD